MCFAVGEWRVSLTETTHSSPLFDTVNYPIHMKNLSVKELKQLGDELRSDVIFNVSKTGGHLGSSPSVVELVPELNHQLLSPPVLRYVLGEDLDPRMWYC